MVCTTLRFSENCRNFPQKSPISGFFGWTNFFGFFDFLEAFEGENRKIFAPIFHRNHKIKFHTNISALQYYKLSGSPDNITMRVVSSNKLQISYQSPLAVTCLSIPERKWREAQKSPKWNLGHVQKRGQHEKWGWGPMGRHSCTCRPHTHSPWVIAQPARG